MNMDRVLGLLDHVSPERLTTMVLGAMFFAAAAGLLWMVFGRGPR